LVEEHPIETDFSKIDIEYCSLANWDEVRARIQTFQNITPEKMNKTLELF